MSMNRKLMVVLTVTVFALAIGHTAGEAKDGPCCPEETAQDKNVGNTICPVSDGIIKEGEAGTVEYEGKVYNLCCAMCAKDFKKDPKKYIEKVEAMQKKEQAKGDVHEHDHGTH